MTAPPAGRIRIIGGHLRGSKLAVPQSAGLRPTPDRVRETLFNWLRGRIDGARCLDLFAGSGAVGIEALSRGAAAVEFVEREPALATRLRENLERLHATGASVHCADAMAWLRTTPQPFDLVFLDPPFALDLAPPCAQALEADGWLAARAMIYVEQPRQRQLQLPANWIVHREGQAGALAYTLFSRDKRA